MGRGEEGSGGEGGRYCYGRTERKWRKVEYTSIRQICVGNRLWRTRLSLVRRENGGEGGRKRSIGEEGGEEEGDGKGGRHTNIFQIWVGNRFWRNRRILWILFSLFAKIPLEIIYIFSESKIMKGKGEGGGRREGGEVIFHHYWIIINLIIVW